MVVVPFWFRRDLFKFSRDHGNTFQKISQNFISIELFHDLRDSFHDQVDFLKVEVYFLFIKIKVLFSRLTNFLIDIFSFADPTFAPFTKNKYTLFIKTALKKHLLKNQPNLQKDIYNHNTHTHPHT